MEYTVFDSRSLHCKNPYGAVACHTEISVALRPLSAEGFLSCRLVLQREFGETEEEIPLSPAGLEKDRTVFAGSFQAPGEPELCWYYFRFEKESGGTVRLGKNGYCVEEEMEARPWQLTVYDDSLKTPGWFGQGVTYQIFPDRFCRTEIPDPAGMLGERTVHRDWGEPVELPEEQGAYVNRDFFGGSLGGIEEKLEYLKSLHVTTIYLCPIFEADSNHRYNTGDYETVDPMLGTAEDFERLCRRAGKLGMHVMLDGVFNHTGSNSRYFNALGAYPSVGAAQSRKSPYYPWYTFQKWPKKYTSWWGIDSLPAVNEMDPAYAAYIVEGENSIIRRWLRAGADAWRLDVADELPDAFIEKIRRVMMEEKPDSFLLGEVWEDGSNKIAYSQRRKYLLGRETHGLMNYPFRVSALAYLQGGDAGAFRDAMEEIRENYPPDAFNSAMNMLGTHDTPRALTMLGGPAKQPSSRRERLAYRLSQEEYGRGKKLLMAGAVLLYAFPGSPTLFYGDEAGMQGYEDPMNRGTFPWGMEDETLYAWYRKLGRLREVRPSLRLGGLRWMQAEGHLLAFAREWRNEITIAVINVGRRSNSLELDWPGRRAADALSGSRFIAVDGKIDIFVPPQTGMLLI